MSLGVHEQHVKAQHAVDDFADQGFPVQNLEIVGTELRSIERVTGRLTRGKIAAAGRPVRALDRPIRRAHLSLFSNQSHLGLLVTSPLLGAPFGLAWSQFGYSVATRHGNRVFASVSQVVATKHEVLVEHEHAVRAQELLATMPALATI